MSSCNWDDLRYFLAVAETGSLSGAARRLKVDHATVSRRLTALEGHLQARLVDRLPRACQLTMMGERVLEYVGMIEEHAFSIERVASGGQSQLKGEVTVSATPMTVETILAVRMDEFRERYPGILLALSAQNQLVSLVRREADLALRMRMPSEPSNVVRKLGHIPHALYARHDYRYLKEPDLWEFILYDAQNDQFAHQEWLKEAIGNRSIACKVSTTAGQQAAARSGGGVASLPRFLGDADDQLVRVPFEGQLHCPDLWLVVHPDMRRSAPVRAVMDFIIEIFQDFDLRP